MPVEERTARIEGILEQMSERISDLRAEVTERISALEGRVSSLETKVEGHLQVHLGQQIQDNFRWTMAILIGSWVTIIAVILARG
ncbi:MAG: hypothetical protein HYS70_00190 [Nitrospinae bacterium]|nr:hypothetical protein [Nitrospinota bacterium]